MDERKRSFFSDGKNLLILALALTALVEFGLLVSRGPSGQPSGASAPSAPSGPAETVTALGLSLDPEKAQTLLVALDRPIPSARPGEKLPAPAATITPDVKGAWSFASPYMLRFEAEERFKPAVTYAVALKPEAFLPPPLTLAGATTLTAVYGLFEARRLALHMEPAPDGKGMVVIKGSATFNRQVDPEAVLKHLRLVDPLRGPGAPVPLVVTTGYATRKIEFESEPVPKNREPRDLVLTVTAGLRPEKGELSLGADVSKTVTVVLDPVLKIKKAEAESQDNATLVRLSVSTPVDPDEAAKAISIEPKTAFRVAADQGDLLLSGDFRPGDEYAITIEKGLTAADGAVLDKPFARTVLVPDLEPSARFRDQGIFLARGGYKNLAIQTVNTENVDLTVDRVYRNNLFSLFAMEYGAFEEEYGGYQVNHHLGDRIARERLTVPFEQNKRLVTPVNLEKHIKDHAPGIYRIGLSVPGSNQGFQRWVLLTDLGIVAKRGREDLLVFVASTSTLKSVAGATVRVVSDQNQEVAKGVTDADGLFRAVVPVRKLEKNRPFMVLVEKGDDLSFLLYENFRVDPTGLDVSGLTPSETGLMSFLYGERDIYRPGETARGLALVRTPALTTPAPMPLKLVLRDPQYRVVGESVVRSDERGVAPFSLPLPSFALTGPYNLELMAGEKTIGNYRFQVEAFVPDRIAAKIVPGAPSAAPGGSVSFGVAGDYLFGPPASGLPVEAKARLVKAAFAPKGLEGYAFGDPERSFEDMEFFSTEANLDEAGRATFEAAVPSGLKPPAALEAVLTARVRESGGRGVTALERIPVHAYPYYPGLKKPASAAVSPGAPTAFEWISVTPDGAAAPSGALTARFYKDNWQTVLRLGPDGSYNYESVRDPRLVEEKAIPAGASKGAVSFTPPSHGAYRLVLADPATGAASQVEVHAGGFGYSPWALENPARVELKPDKKDYASGETAVVQIRAPFAGRVLLTVENDAVRDVQTIDLAGNTGQALVPIKAEYLPGVYVTATLARKVGDLKPGMVSRAYGATPIFVDRQSGRMPVSISVPEVMRPEGKLSIDVVSYSGSVITVAAVDEGILQLIAQKTADPHAAMYAKRSLDVSTSDTFALLLPETPPLAGKSKAGGGDSLEDLSNFTRSDSPAAKLVAFWSGPVVADGAGKATVSFDVPQFQGAIRVMAVASDGRRFGSAAEKVRVKSPLSVTPTFPRFLATGDVIELPVAVRNETGGDGTFTARLAAGGQALAADGPKTVTLANGKEALLTFKVSAKDAEGLATFEVAAEGRGETTLVKAEIGVRSPLPPRTATQAGSLEKPELTLPDLAGAEFAPKTARRDIYVGAMPLLRFAGNLESLLRYPYGCVEQTVSRVMPLLYFGDLAKSLAPGAVEGGSAPAMVNSGIRRLMTMRQYNGGYGMWPDAAAPDPWASIYAAHFLVEAIKAGFSVDKWAMNATLGYVGRAAKNLGDKAPSDLKRAAYACFVLALAGKADIGAMDVLRDLEGHPLPPDARGLLSASYAAVGNARAAGQLAGGPAPGETVARQSGGNLDSPLRDKALYLAALTSAVPDDPRLPTLTAEVARLLEATRRPTTQENAFALLALGKFAARQKAKGPFSGKVLAGKGLLSDVSSEKALLLRNIPESGDLRLVMDQGYPPGAASYSVLTRGTPKPESYAPASEGLELKREFLARDGAPLADSKTGQGQLVVIRAAVRSASGPLRNVVLENLLPAGLEVENPRLATTEKLPWMEDKEDKPSWLDLRDDRILIFCDLPDGEWRTFYALVRAVVPGVYALPPAQAEAMYAPDIRASGALGTFTVTGPK